MGRVWQERTSAIGFALLLTIVVLAPLPFGANRPFFWFLLSFLMAILMIWWAVTALLSRQPSAVIADVPLSRFWFEAVLMAGLCVWFYLQAAPFTPQEWHHPVWVTRELLATGGGTAISAAPDETMDALVRFLGYGAVFFLAMQYGRNRRRARTAIRAIAFAGILYSLYGVVIDLGGFGTILWYKRWAYQDSLTSTFVNRNSFAAFAGITLICIVAILAEVERRAETLVSREGRRIYLEYLASRGTFLFIGAVIVLTAIFLSHSRAGLLVTALGVATFFFVRWWGQRRQNAAEVGERGAPRTGAQRKGKRLVPLLMLAAVVIIVTISGAVTWQRVENEALDDAGGRLEIYAATWSGIADRPILGHGMGSYRWVFESYRTPRMLRADTVDKAHNSYLDFAFDAGIPALAALMLILLSLFWRCMIGVRRRLRDAIYPTIAVSATMLLAAHSVVDFPLQIPAITVLFMFLLGIGFAQSWSSREA